VLKIVELAIMIFACIAILVTTIWKELALKPVPLPSTVILEFVRSALILVTAKPATLQGAPLAPQV